MKIWIFRDGAQQGPFELDKLEGIAPDTPVWYEGLPRWMPASEAPLTADRWGGKAAEAKTEPTITDTQRLATQVQPATLQAAATAKVAPRTYIGWGLFLTLCCCSPMGVVSLILALVTTILANRGSGPAAQQLSAINEWVVIVGLAFAVALLPLTLSVWF